MAGDPPPLDTRQPVDVIEPAAPDNADNGTSHS